MEWDTVESRKLELIDQTTMANLPSQKHLSNLPTLQQGVWVFNLSLSRGTRGTVGTHHETLVPWIFEQHDKQTWTPKREFKPRTRTAVKKHQFRFRHLLLSHPLQYRNLVSGSKSHWQEDLAFHFFNIRKKSIGTSNDWFFSYLGHSCHFGPYQTIRHLIFPYRLQHDLHHWVQVLW